MVLPLNQLYSNKNFFKKDLVPPSFCPQGREAFSACRHSGIESPDLLLIYCLSALFTSIHTQAAVYLIHVAVIQSSVMSDCFQPHGLSLSRLPCPWDFPGKNTGLGCHFLLQGIFSTQGSNPSLFLPH